LDRFYAAVISILWCCTPSHRLKSFPSRCRCLDLPLQRASTCCAIMGRRPECCVSSAACTIAAHRGQRQVNQAPRARRPAWRSLRAPPEGCRGGQNATKSGRCYTAHSLASKNSRARKSWLTGKFWTPWKFGAQDSARCNDVFRNAASSGCCARHIADILSLNRHPVLSSDGRFGREVAAMTALQWFLLGLMVSWTPSVIFLACIAVQAGARRHGRASTVAKPIDRIVALHNR
jgi:hypothetical protein